MTIPATSPLNLGLIQALNRLGVKGALLPSLEAGVQPVMVMADISESVSSELVESRRQSFDQAAGVLGLFHHVLLYSLSAGGLVVESLTIVLSGAGVQPRVVFDVSPRGVFGAPLGLVSDIGGIPGVSFTHFATGGAGIVSPAKAGAFICLNPVGAADFWTVAPARLFVPAGQALTIQAPAANVGLTVQMVWRELADIQGSQ